MVLSSFDLPVKIIFIWSYHSQACAYIILYIHCLMLNWLRQAALFYLVSKLCSLGISHCLVFIWFPTLSCVHFISHMPYIRLFSRNCQIFIWSQTFLSSFGLPHCPMCIWGMTLSYIRKIFLNFENDLFWSHMLSFIILIACFFVISWRRIYI